jgi:hypothetical protein
MQRWLEEGRERERVMRAWGRSGCMSEPARPWMMEELSDRIRKRREE